MTRCLRACFLLFAFLLSVWPLQAQQGPSAGTLVPSLPTVGDPGQTYALYLPSSYSRERSWPLLLAFDPGARGQLAVERFRAAAERYGYIVAASNLSRNGPRERQGQAFEALWTDLRSRFRVDERRVYIAGFSAAARLSSSLAQDCKCAAGVVLFGGGLALELKPDASLPFVVFAATGIGDYHLLELRDQQKQMEKAGTIHRFVEFSGGHEWPPAQIATEAVEWLHLQAISRNLVPPDQNFLKSQWEARLRAAKALEKTEDLLGAHREYRSLAADFNKLRNTSEPAERATKLERSPRLRAAQEQQEAAVALERRTMQEFEQDLARLPAEISQSSQSVNDLRRKLSNQKAQVDRERDPYRGPALARALQWEMLRCVDLAERAARAEQYRQVIAYLDIVIEVANHKAGLYYLLASAFAREKDDKQALAALRAARRNGFNDRARLLSDPAFQSLRELPEFQALAQEGPVSAP